MNWAVHNLNSPAVEMINGGYTHDGTAIIKVGAPLHEAESFDAAEQWRHDRLAERRMSFTR